MAQQCTSFHSSDRYGKMLDMQQERPLSGKMRLLRVFIISINFGLCKFNINLYRQFLIRAKVDHNSQQIGAAVARCGKKENRADYLTRSPITGKMLIQIYHCFRRNGEFPVNFEKVKLAECQNRKAF